jgi:hypothetical protein
MQEKGEGARCPIIWRAGKRPGAYCFATCWVGDGACYTLKPVPGGFVLVVVGVVMWALRSAGFLRFTRDHSRLKT